ncbi:MAG: ABC transporter ATP-binding protein [Bacillota bacterium]
MIKITDMSKSYDDFLALNNVCMNISKGSIYGLLGPNGAGKTTLIKTLVGVYRQNKGKITIQGEEVYENNNVKSKIIYIPDNLYFSLSYTVKNMAQLYKSIYASWNQERFDKLSKVFDIELGKKVNNLSKGMQRQVAFWLGLSVMPDYLILDEPLDGLDPVMKQKVKNLIVQDVADRNMTVLISSHNLRELDDLCDHIGILHKGSLVVEKDIDDLKSDVHKIQVAFKNDIPHGLTEELEIMNEDRRGSVGVYIVRGNKDSIVQKLQKHNPVIMDILPLTLEEIFIYEMGDAGYDIKNIIF